MIGLASQPVANVLRATRGLLPRALKQHTSSNVIAFPRVLQSTLAQGMRSFSGLPVDRFNPDNPAHENLIAKDLNDFSRKSSVVICDDHGSIDSANPTRPVILPNQTFSDDYTVTKLFLEFEKHVCPGIMPFFSQFLTKENGDPITQPHELVTRTNEYIDEAEKSGSVFTDKLNSSVRVKNDQGELYNEDGSSFHIFWLGNNKKAINVSLHTKDKLELSTIRQAVLSLNTSAPNSVVPHHEELNVMNALSISVTDQKFGDYEARQNEAPDEPHFHVSGSRYVFSITGFETLSSVITTSGKLSREEGKNIFGQHIHNLHHKAKEETIPVDLARLKPFITQTAKENSIAVLAVGQWALHQIIT